MSVDRTKVGIVGCGNISGAYFGSLKRFPFLEVSACADLNMGVAKAKAKEYEIPHVHSVDELMADPEIEIVVNLTIPAAHAEVGVKALKAGKHTHSEKPIAVTRKDGRELLRVGKETGLRVGCAPDTFLGGGHQTARKLIDEGVIGEPLAATAFMLCHGHESWHSNPEFYYKPGGGPMLDMGPYYVTALVNMLGPVRRVTGSTRISMKERLITSQPKSGQRIHVEVPTHYAGVLDFEGGAIGTIVTSFDVWGHHLPHIEIHGTEGSLSVPDPNSFSGSVKLRLPRYRDWVEVALTHGYNENFRGLGVADLAKAVRSGRPHRVSGELAYHVFDVMQAVQDAGEQGRHIELESTCERPAALPMGLNTGEVDD